MLAYGVYQAVIAHGSNSCRCNGGGRRCFYCFKINITNICPPYIRLYIYRKVKFLNLTLVTYILHSTTHGKGCRQCNPVEEWNFSPRGSYMPENSPTIFFQFNGSPLDLPVSCGLPSILNIFCKMNIPVDTRLSSRNPSLHVVHGFSSHFGRMCKWRIYLHLSMQNITTPYLSQGFLAPPVSQWCRNRIEQGFFMHTETELSTWQQK